MSIRTEHRPPPITALADQPAAAPHRLWWLVGLVVALALVVAVGFLRPGATSQTPFAPDNPQENGARAVAQILTEQGVSVQYVQTTSAALADAREAGTLFILNPGSLRPEQQQALAEAPGDIVLANLDRDIDDLTDRISSVAGGTRTERAAECADEHPVAAGTVHGAGPMITADGADDVVLCFASADHDDAAMYASWTQDGRTWRALGNADLMLNENLTSEGNAALILRILGQQEHLTWYVPDAADTFGLEGTSAAPEFPLLAPHMLALYALIALALILWRGRRLGPVVLEPLPVTVKATETTRGRGRLYRRHEAFGHTGSSLRAGAVDRISGRLGVSRSAGPDEVVEAISRATGRPSEQIHSVLYSPPPHDNASLVALAEALDTMESEVHSR